MRVISALVALYLFLAVASAVPALLGTRLTTDELIRIRCSHNPDEEIFFYFNGTISAYLGQDTGPFNGINPNIKTLFNAVGMNVAKCFKATNGNWYLVGREAMWYINPQTDEILTSWTNFNGETVNVMHVDNDPVMQTFQPFVPFYPGQVYGDETILPSDVTTYLNYANPIHSPAHNATFDAYSPQNWYQASELFKFVSPTSQVFSDRPAVDSTFVSWTRTSLYLPWMKHGNLNGYLVYSFQGAKVPDYTHLPAKIRADVENRVPHYKHAPESKCMPNMAGTGHGNSGVTSWSFFKEQFDNYLAGVRYPLATARQYSCNPAIVAVPDTQCKASATLTQVSSWQSGGQTVTQYDIKITNTGSRPIKTASIDISFANIQNSWNINRQGTSNVYDVNLWNNIQVGSSVSGAYGIQVTGSPAVSVASVTCN